VSSPSKATTRQGRYDAVRCAGVLSVRFEAVTIRQAIIFGPMRSRRRLKKEEARDFSPRCSS
jgi:hypothetical protein